MTVTLTYDPTLARVRVAASAAPSNTDQVTVERSTDQIRWTVVRGGQNKPLAAGAATVDDYEFSPDVQNFYRVSYIDVDASADLGVGTAGTGNNASVVPGLPAGWQPGDLLVLIASIRNSGAGTVNTPTGWTPVVSSGNFAMFARRAQSGDVAPTVSFTGGVLNADTMAQIYGRRNASEGPAVVNSQLNGSAQDMAYPAVLVPVAGTILIVAGWKQDDWTSVAPIPSGIENAEVIATAGDDAAMVWDRVIGPAAGATYAAGSFVVTGGAAAISRTLLAAFPQAPWYIQETANITPTIDSVWIKSVSRPFLNQTVTPVNFPDIQRTSRTGIFPIVGRSKPIAVTDVQTGRGWTQDFLVQTQVDFNKLDMLMASGDILFIQVPSSGQLSYIPSGYVAAGDVATRHPWKGELATSVLSVPCTEVAPPGPDVVGVTYTCQGVLNDYATCADLLAAFATCADLLDNVGSAVDVIVP